jgi:hypothetical protein
MGQEVDCFHRGLKLRMNGAVFSSVLECIYSYDSLKTNYAQVILPSYVGCPISDCSKDSDLSWQNYVVSLSHSWQTIKGKVHPCTGTEALYRLYGI